MLPALGIAASLLSEVGYKALKGVFSHSSGAKSGGNTTQEGIAGQADSTGQNVPARSSRPDLTTLFSKIDGNGDGSISKDEFLAFKSQVDGTMSALLKTQESGTTDAAATAASATDPAATTASIGDKIFTRMDKNGDGTVSKDEFLAFKPAEPGAQSRAQKILSKLDTDGDGTVSNAELLAFAQKVTGTTATASTTADGAAAATGTVSSAQSLVDSLLSRIDKDGDGSISKDELAGALSQRRGHHHQAAAQATTSSGDAGTSGDSAGPSQAAFLSALLDLQSDKAA